MSKTIHVNELKESGELLRALSSDGLTIISKEGEILAWISTEHKMFNA